MNDADRRQLAEANGHAPAARKERNPERNAAIRALHESNPKLTNQAIGHQYGLTAAQVHHILYGRADGRAPLRGTETEIRDLELAAIGTVLAVLAPLNDPAKRRVLDYLRARLD